MTACSRFNQSLFNLVKAGRVTEKEALSKATNPQALEMNFKGIFLDEGRRIISSKTHACCTARNAALT